jgi:hypothetical protein
MVCSLGLTADDENGTKKMLINFVGRFDFVRRSALVFVSCLWELRNQSTKAIIHYTILFHYPLNYFVIISIIFLSLRIDRKN